MLETKEMPHRGLEVTSASTESDRLRLTTIRRSEQEDQHGILELIPVTAEIVRVRYTESHFDEAPSPALLAQPDFSDWKVSSFKDSIRLETDVLTVHITRSTAAIQFCDKTDQVIVAEPKEGGKILQRIEVKEIQSENMEVEEIASVDGIKHRVTSNSEATSSRQAYASTLCWNLQEDEAIYGLGQHEKGCFDYRDREEFLYQANMKVAIPTFVSNRGYAIHQDQHCFAHFSALDGQLRWWSEAVPQLDYFFIYGPDFDEIIDGLRQLTGDLPMLPRWAYGYIQSKERYESASELIAVARRYRDEKIPIDALVLDWSSWEDGLWGEKHLDPARFPDPSAMMQHLHRMNIKLMVSIWPNMRQGGQNHQAMSEKEFLLNNQSTYNSYSENARNLYWQQCNEGLFRHGIDAWWCDCTEPFESDWNGTVRLPDWKRADMNTCEFKRYIDATQINSYSLFHSKGIYAGQRSTSQSKRVVNLTRSASPSQQRYGTITWSGDIEARWSRLRHQLADGLNFAVTGNPRWTFDIGGFFVKPGLQWFWDGQYPTGHADLGYRELYLRWLQTATFLPMFRSHGTDTAREIWRFGEPGTVFYDNIKASIELRYRLLPYIYSLAAMEVRQRYTMFRSLLFDFRADPETHQISDQFMLGPALMVCPMLEPIHYGPHSKPLKGRPAERLVYLPAGANWFNFQSRESFRGGQWIVAAAPLENIPVFVRAGSILPMTAPESPIQHSGDAETHPIEWNIFGGADTDFYFYEDAGDGYDYEDGAFLQTHLHWDDSSESLTTRKTTGTYPSEHDFDHLKLNIIPHEPLR